MCGPLSSYCHSLWTCPSLHSAGNRLEANLFVCLSCASSKLPFSMATQAWESTHMHMNKYNYYTCHGCPLNPTPRWPHYYSRYGCPPNPTPPWPPWPHRLLQPLWMKANLFVCKAPTTDVMDVLQLVLLHGHSITWRHALLPTSVFVHGSMCFIDHTRAVFHVMPPPSGGKRFVHHH